MKENIEFMEKSLDLILTRFDNLDKKIDKLFNIKDVLDGDELLDNQDLCQLLGVTKRTIQRYREKGILKYYMIDGRKAYYLKSEIPKILSKKGKK